MSRFQEFMNKFPAKDQKLMKVASEIEVEKLPLASIGLTQALGGGVGRGRITLIYGNQSAGKTMLALQSIAEWQSRGLVCAFIDAEKAFDKNFAARLGVNIDELLVFNESSQRTVTDIFSKLLENDIDAVVLDSISDIAPNQFINPDGTMKDSENTKQIGAHSKAIKSLIDHIHYCNKDTAVILLSQTTTEIGQTYVKQIPHGGKKPLFASSQVIKLTSSATDAKQIKGQHLEGSVLVERPIGRTVEATVDKNKIGLQSGAAEYDIYYGGDTIGIDFVGELVNLAIRQQIVEKKGAWLYYDGETFQGKPNFVKHLKDNREVFLQLKQSVDEAYGNQDQ